MTQPDPILSWQLPPDLVAAVAEVLIRTPLLPEEVEERQRRQQQQAAHDRSEPPPADGKNSNQGRK